MEVKNAAIYKQIVKQKQNRIDFINSYLADAKQRKEE